MYAAFLAVKSARPIRPSTPLFRSVAFPSRSKFKETLSPGKSVRQRELGSGLRGKMCSVVATARLGGILRPSDSHSAISALRVRAVLTFPLSLLRRTLFALLIAGRGDIS